MNKKFRFSLLAPFLFSNVLLAQGPVADAGDDVTVSSGCTQTVTLDGRGSTGDNLSYLWLAIDGCAVLTDFDEDKLIFEIPQTDIDYDYYLSLTVTDANGDSSSDTVVVTVLGDHVPNADAGADFTACKYSISGSDFRVYLNGSESFDVEDSTDIDFLWTVLDEGITISSGQSTKSKPYFEHPLDLTVDTEFRIELKVTDANGYCSDKDTVTVTCLADMCPVADAGSDMELSSGCNDTLLLDGTSSVDPDGGTLTYSWISLDGYITNLENSTSAQPTFNFPTFTTDKDLRFQLTVSDGTNEDIDTVEIEYVNDEAPIADAGEDISTNLISVILDGSGSIDDNISNLDYNWRSLDGGISIMQGNTICIVNFDDSHAGGVFRFELEVDDDYCIDKDTVSVTVLDNLSPIAEAGDNLSLSGGCQTFFYLDGTDSEDPEGTTLTYAWSVADELSSNLTNTTSADSVMFTISESVVGENVTFYLTVTDEAGLTDTDSIIVSVLDDLVPVANAGEDFESCEYTISGSTYRVYLDGTASYDFDGTLKYKWTQIEGEEVDMSSSQSKKVTPYFKYPTGLTENIDIQFELRVYDSEEYCEDFDTVKVTLLADKCPTADAGEDMDIPSGCNTTIDLISVDSFDPEDSTLTYTWTSLDGYTSLISNANSDTALFTIPDIEIDTVFSFVLSVSDGVNLDTDSLVATYILNDAPVAVAGNNITTCEYKFDLNGSRSYDINKNELDYAWDLDLTIDEFDDCNADQSICEGDDDWDAETMGNGVWDIGERVKDRETDDDLIGNEGFDADEGDVIITFTSPIDLEEDSTRQIMLRVYDGLCYSYDALFITINENICPIADAGETVRIPKFSTRPVLLNAATGSFDPDSSELTYEWTTPTGSIVSDSVVTVEDLEPTKRYSRYIYKLKVMDAENAISEDSVEVIFANFSTPESPAIYAVADHNRVLVSWDADSESSVDSLTGYADFEGYKLYRSIDGGITWGSDEDRLYDYNGHFVGWKPYAQFDLSAENDVDHCIYADEDCESGLTREISISGLDPLSPRFSLGNDSGIEYSFVDSNVIDGVKYSYTVTAYDIGFDPFDLDMENLGIAMDTVLIDTIDRINYSYVVDSVYHAGGCVYYSIISANEIVSVDTLWTTTNPDEFLGPDSLTYYNEAGEAIRTSSNPTRGYYSLESARGDSGKHNFITVIPGYTALDISFPDASNIEALFKTDSNNIGNGIREYFIVDRTKIVQDQVMYEIQAEQGKTAVDGMACEDPYVYGYLVEDSQGSPLTTKTFFQEDLGFLEEDSISGLPGTVLENGTYFVPEYAIINKVGQWTNQFKGIRFKIQNELKLNPSSPPDIELDTLVWSWASPDSLPMDSATIFGLSTGVLTELSYTNLASYKRRLNGDYMIEFFDSPVGDSIHFGEDANGRDMYMYTPFRITNLLTNKKVGLNCNDYGILDEGPQAVDNGAGDYVWTRGEDILMQEDTLKIAGVWESEYNYNFDLNFGLVDDFFSTDTSSSFRDYDNTKSYSPQDLVMYKQMLWEATSSVDPGEEPLSKYHDINEDGVVNNPWRIAYPWRGGEKLVLSPKKFFVDGDSWYSDMAALGKEVGIADTLNMDTIRVVPNPYKASSRFNESQNARKIRFTHLPKRCRISIYTLTGEHVTTFDHEQEFDGNAWWNLRTGNNQNGPEVAPGLYFYIIQFDDKKTKDHIGKFAIVR